MKDENKKESLLEDCKKNSNLIKNDIKNNGLTG